MPMFVQVLVLSYSIIKNRSMVQMQSVDGFSGQELISSKYSVTAGKLSQASQAVRFPRPRKEDVVSHPVSE